jgi:HlyD family secretion protein
VCLAACSEAPSSYQGYVEGDFLNIGPEEGGRVTQLLVREGDRVEAGTPLFTMDDTTAQADVTSAQTALAAAEATLADMKSGARQPEIEALIAQRDQGQANLQLSKIQFDRQNRLVESGARPKEMLDEARAALTRDQARIVEINKDIQVAQLGARINQIEAARQEVDAAQAVLDKANYLLARRKVEAPAQGQVSEIVTRPGEVVAAGVPVVTMLPPGNLKIRFYVPQGQMAQLGQGDEVSITCDGCPGPTTARISFVADEVEFTPPVIFSDQSREKLMVMMEARTQKPVDFLRPGQPVDVTPAGTKAKTTPKNASQAGQ